LQFANLVANDANIAELAYAGCDGVSNLIAFDDLVNDRAGSVNGFARLAEQEDGTAFDCDFAYSL
jgi:hypothetical protein